MTTWIDAGYCFSISWVLGQKPAQSFSSILFKVGRVLVWSGSWQPNYNAR